MAVRTVPVTVTVRVAAYRDIGPWLDLAAGVEALFGKMLDDAEFYDALLRNIARGTAFCVRRGDGSAGAPMVGGLLFSPARAARPENRIGWLAVDAPSRRSGVGAALVRHVLETLPMGATLSVVTFEKDLETGLPARRFYENFGFEAAELVDGPGGGSRQVYRLVIP